MGASITWFLLAQTPSFSKLCVPFTLHSNHRRARVIFLHKNDFSRGSAIFSLHTLASPSGRNVNYDEKQLTGGGFSCSFSLYRFRKYVSYGFPIRNFCNPGVHYETLCIILILYDKCIFPLPVSSFIALTWPTLLK
jgi:hypothetical protein